MAAGQGERRFMISRKQLEEVAATVQGVPVFGCLPGSTAAEAGARYGDIVLGVNGVRTRDIDEYLSARSLRADGIELLILRGGQELSVFVEFRLDEERLDSLADQIADGRYLGTSDLPEAEVKGLPS
jgi:S1-C subfamily serine protease